jgi:hypothetical protein
MQHYFNRSKVIQSIQVLFFGLILLTSPPLALSQEAPNMVNSTEAVISDMSLPHEGRPHGVPDSYSWISGPRISMGNDPGDFSALTLGDSCVRIHQVIQPSMLVFKSRIC